jgi:hypothetical protein
LETFDVCHLQLPHQGYLDCTRFRGAGGTSQKRGRSRTGGATQQESGSSEGYEVVRECLRA